MEEYPKNPTRRELERQQAIASVISGMCYRDKDLQMKIDFVQEPQLPFDEPVILEKTDEANRGFNYATYLEYVKEEQL